MKIKKGSIDNIKIENVVKIIVALEKKFEKKTVYLAARRYNDRIYQENKPKKKPVNKKSKKYQENKPKKKPVNKKSKT